MKNVHFYLCSFIIFYLISKVQSMALIEIEWVTVSVQKIPNMKQQRYKRMSQQ